MKTLSTLMLLMGAIFSGACSVTPEIPEGTTLEVDTPIGKLKAKRENGVIKSEGESNREIEIIARDIDGKRLGEPIVVPQGNFDIILPEGTYRIQVREITPMRALDTKFWFYSLPPLEEELMPGGQDQFSHAFGRVDYIGASDGWEETSETFFNLGTSTVPVSGTTVQMFVEVIADRSYQHGGVLSKLPGLVVVADDEQIVDFTATLMGSTTLTGASSTARGDSGAWGSWASAYTFFKPSAAWYGSGEIYVSYTLASGTTREISFQMGL